MKTKTLTRESDWKEIHLEKLTHPLRSKKLSDKCSPNLHEPSCWKILLITSEVAFYQSFVKDLQNLQFMGKPCQLLRADSSQQAREILQTHADLALLLLEEEKTLEESEWPLVRWIRQTLKNKFVRIIFLTSIPQQPPSAEMIADYDIHDYQIKTETFTSKLTTTIFSSLRFFHHLVTAAQGFHQLEEKVQERTLELQQSLAELENRNTILAASNSKLEELNRIKEHLLRRLSTIYTTHFHALHEFLEKMPQVTLNGVPSPLKQAINAAEKVDEFFRPVSSMYQAEQAMRTKRVLLVEPNRKQQVIANMALRGTGVELDLAGNAEQAQSCLESGNYDIIFIDSSLIELTTEAHQRTPQVPIVFMTSGSVADYLRPLLEHPFLGNIVSRNADDRSLTLKNIITTVTKLLNRDLFGLEKYLNWGVDVTQMPVTSSIERHQLLEQMTEHLSKFNLHRWVIEKSAMVAEELLMNAIYDAPSNPATGEACYNDLPRTIPVHLSPHQQGRLRYACDGSLLAISVEDPFGRLDRQTVLEYLDRCYQGVMQTIPEKGGAGRGLFQIINTVDLLVINVKPRQRTEVIALFNIDPQRKPSNRTNSFHFFVG